LFRIQPNYSKNLLGISILEILDDVLCKTIPGSMKGVVVVKEGAIESIMNEFHGSALGGHSGFNKTNSAIKIRYWWPKMTEDIRTYVSTYAFKQNFHNSSNCK
jgi:hypothetical protein